MGVKISQLDAATEATDYTDASEFIMNDPNGVTKRGNLADLSSGFFCNLKCATITISSVEMLALSTTPKEIVPSQGAGTIIQVVSAFGKVNFATTPYATNVKFEIKNATATIAQMEHSFFINSTINKYDAFVTRQTSNVSNENMEANQALIATVDIGDPTAGDSDFQIWVYYRVVTV